MPEGLDKIQYFPLQEVKKIAQFHVKKFHDRVENKGIDAKGDQLPKYSEGYIKQLQADFRNKSGKRTKYAGISLETSSQKIAKRTFRLRGLTMKNFRVREVKKDSYQIGWDGEAAGIVEENMARGRDVGSGIPDDEFQWVLRQFGDVVENQFKQLKDKTVIVGK